MNYILLLYNNLDIFKEDNFKKIENRKNFSNNIFFSNF